MALQRLRESGKKDSIKAANPEFDSSHIQKIKDKAGTLSHLQVLVVAKELDKIWAQILEPTGEPPEPDTVVVEAKGGGTERVPLYTYDAATKSYIFGVYKWSLGARVTPLRFLFEKGYEARLTPGMVLRINIGFEKELPESIIPGQRACVRNVACSVKVVKDKKTNDLHAGVFWGGEAIEPTPHEVLNAEHSLYKRMQLAMPHSKQLLPGLDEGAVELRVAHFYGGATEAEQEILAKPFFTNCYGVRLPLNRVVPANYDSEKDDATALRFILPDEGLFRLNTAAESGTVVLLTRHDRGAFYGQKEGSYSYKQEVTLDVIQYPHLPSDDGAKMLSLTNVTFYGDNFMTALGIPLTPFLDALDRGPAGPIPMDIVVHPDYSRSKGVPDNQPGPRRDQYPLGLFSALGVCCYPRIEDWARAQGLRVPYSIVEARYKNVRDYCGNDDATSLAPLELEKLLKYIRFEEATVSPQQRKPTKFVPFTYERNPGFIFLDVLRNPLPPQSPESWDFYAVPCEGMDADLINIKMIPLMPGDTEKEMQQSPMGYDSHTPQEGAAALLAALVPVIKKREKRFKTDADVEAALMATPSLWLQPQKFEGKDRKLDLQWWRIPYFAFIAIPSTYTPFEIRIPGQDKRDATEADIKDDEEEERPAKRARTTVDDADVQASQA